MEFYQATVCIFSEFENHAPVVIVGVLLIAAVPTTPSCCSFDSSRMDDDITKRSLITNSAKILLRQLTIVFSTAIIR